HFDAIILPDSEGEELTAGRQGDVVPPEFAGGIGADGANALKAFAQDGGSLIALDGAATFATRAFELPIKDVARAASSSTFFVPGSLLRVDVDVAQPLAYGMAPQTAGFFASSSAFDAGSSPVQTIARYATTDLLVSGWLQGEQVIAGKSA